MLYYYEPINNVDNIINRISNNLSIFNPSEKILSIIKAYLFHEIKYILYELIEHIPIELFFNNYAFRNDYKINEDKKSENNLSSLFFSKIEEKYPTNELSSYISLGINNIDISDIIKKSKINYTIKILNRLYIKNINSIETKFIFGYFWIYRPYLNYFEKIERKYNYHIFKTIYFNYKYLLEYINNEENEICLKNINLFINDNYFENIIKLFNIFKEKIDVMESEDFLLYSTQLSLNIFLNKQEFLCKIENYCCGTLIKLIACLINLYKYCNNFNESYSQIKNIKFFSIFNAVNIIYIPHLQNSSEILKLYSTQNICLIHKKSILLNNKKTLKIIYDNMLGIFDSTFLNIIIDYKTCFELLKVYIEEKIDILKNLLFEYSEIKNSFIQPIIYDFKSYFKNNDYIVKRDYIIKDLAFEESAFHLFNKDNNITNSIFSVLHYIKETCFEEYEKLKWNKEKKYFCYYLNLIFETYSIIINNNIWNLNIKKFNYYDYNGILLNDIQLFYNKFPIISVLLLKIFSFKFLHYRKEKLLNNIQIFLSYKKDTISYKHFNLFIKILNNLINYEYPSNFNKKFFQLNLFIIISNLSFIENLIKKNITNLKYFYFKDEFIQFKNLKNNFYFYNFQNNRVVLFKIMCKSFNILPFFLDNKEINDNNIWENKVIKDTIEYKLLYNNINNKKEIFELFWEIINKYPIFENENLVQNIENTKILNTKNNEILKRLNLIDNENDDEEYYYENEDNII